MFGPEGRPQHCCAWLSVASSFPECASLIIPEEVNPLFNLSEFLHSFRSTYLDHEILVVLRPPSEHHITLSMTIKN